MSARLKTNSGNLLLAISLIAIGALTLVPHPEEAEAALVTPWYCLICGDMGMVDVLLNIALFVPLGLALGLRGVRPRKALLFGLGLAGAIELLQATLVHGRDPSVSDVLTNSAGALAGAVLGRHAGQLWLPSVARARQLALATGLAWLAVMVLSAIGLTADRPVGGVHLVESPATALLEPFRGTVANSTADSLDGSLALAADVRTAGLTDRLAPILELQDSRAFPLARLGQLGQKPTFSRRLLATRALFRTPMVRVYGGVIPEAPVQARIEGGMAGPVLWSSATLNGTSHRAELTLSPGLGWMLLLPLGYPFDVFSRWTSAAWVALPLLLVGFWSGRARIPAAMMLAGAVLLLAAGLEGTAWLFHLGRDGLLAWGLGVGAIMGSWAVGRKS
jgi:hypothetical protein